MDLRLETSCLHEVKLILLHCTKHATLKLHIKESPHIEHLMHELLAFPCGLFH